MKLREIRALAQLGVALRRIWYGKKEISVTLLKRTFEVVYRFITGKNPPQ